MKCPVCRSIEFYVKNPADEFDTREFRIADGKIVFDGEQEAGEELEVGEETETYCNVCTWHGKFDSLKETR